MTVILIGIGTSLFAEATSWLSKKWTGTPFQGFASYAIVLLLAFVAAAIKVGASGVSIVSLKDIAPVFAQVFTYASIWFNVIATNVGLEVKAVPIPIPAQP